MELVPSDTCKLTQRQVEANAVLASPSRYCLLVGGSRSGKTFLMCRALVIRALKGEGSRHGIFRKAFNAVKTSIWSDTMPKVLRLCFPGLKVTQNKQDYYWEFENGSQIWIGGLDEKERTEKVLGTEYATIYLNEASQIGWATVEVVRTRLAQVVPGLRQKLYVDCNPPLTSHWTHRLFIEKRDPESRVKFDNPEDYAWLRINPSDNEQNLDPATLADLARMSARSRKRFWLGEWGSESENALWALEIFDKHRRREAPIAQRIVIGVDPSGTKGEDDERSDLVGIVVVSLGVDGDAYVLEDLTAQVPPREWGRRIVSAVQRHEADLVVGEINFGGAMVGEIIRAASSEMKVPVSFREVRASRGKVIRAEPVAALYDQGKVHHVGDIFGPLEDQLCNFTTMGYMGDRSPDRADALIWALSELFPGMTKKREPKPLRIEGVSAYNAQRF